ncbi:MAG: hypothetical protein ACOYCE_07875 [Limnochordia bacterium]|jgi:hypothetical protein
MIEIQLPGQLLILTAGELTSLLALEPELWQKALQRGKVTICRRQAFARMLKRIDETEERLGDVLDRCGVD